MPRYSPHSEETKRRISAALKGKERPAAQTHGHNSLRYAGKSSTYLTWQKMRERCEKRTDPAFHNYGGRGIKVCKRWQKFENFLVDMGEKPPSMQIDRRDNDGDYKPGNCRWATKKEQANNRRTNRYLTYKGKSLTVTEWASRLGLNPITVAVRLHRGQTVARALRPRWT